VDNTGTGCRGDGVPGSMENTWSRGLWKRLGPGVCGKDGVTGSVEKTGSVVFVTTAHDQRSHHCHPVSFPEVRKCQARLLVIKK